MCHCTQRYLFAVKVKAGLFGISAELALLIHQTLHPTSSANRFVCNYLRANSTAKTAKYVVILTYVHTYKHRSLYKI